MRGESPVAPSLAAQCGNGYTQAQLSSPGFGLTRAILAATSSVTWANLCSARSAELRFWQLGECTARDDASLILGKLGFCARGWLRPHSGVSSCFSSVAAVTDIDNVTCVMTSCHQAFCRLVCRPSRPAMSNRVLSTFTTCDSQD